VARANNLSLSDNNRLLAAVNLAMADTAIAIWSGKRFYGSVPTEVTWRPVTSIPLADSDGNPETAADLDWLPLITTPSHPEYPAGTPAKTGRRDCSPQLLQETTTGVHADNHRTAEPHVHQHRPARADGNNGRVWGGMHYPSTSVSATPWARRLPGTSIEPQCRDCTAA